ncbi:hypothetical protein A3K73_00100 [Candidatus Pacearchaeota archaeon RBG_13_36_9]|nr:MAG: hypothetical protein A3K73_00100 [Candidatus Pacearchaeota archaeon RBG_13_36_9]
MDKKGITWSVRTVAELIAMIIVFGVALIFLSGFKPYEQVDKKICHESVVYKATVPDPEGTKVVNIPLNCKTEKICFAASVLDSPLKWDNCNDHYQGEEYDTIRIGGSSVEERNKEINKVIAEKMAECWSMMGEGKLSIYSRKTTYDAVYCNICTRFAFGQILSGKIGGEVKGTQDYLLSNIVPNTKKTYWQYITNSESNYMYGYNKEDKITTAPKAIVFMESDKSSFFSWAGISVGGFAGGLIGVAVGPLATVGAGVGMVLGRDLGHALDKYFTGNIPRVSSMTLVNYDREGLKKEKCTSFEGQIS